MGKIPNNAAIDNMQTLCRLVTNETLTDFTHPEDARLSGIDICQDEIFTCGTCVWEGTCEEQDGSGCSNWLERQ